MENKNVELRSPKVRNVIGKVPRRLVASAIFIYLIVLLMILAVVCMLNIESDGIVNRLFGL